MLPIQGTIRFSEYSSLYDLIVPKDNKLRLINDLVDFSFIYDELNGKYWVRGKTLCITHRFSVV